MGGLTTDEVRAGQVDLGNLSALHRDPCASARVVVLLQCPPTLLVLTPAGELGGVTKLCQNLPLLELQGEQKCIQV